MVFLIPNYANAKEYKSFDLVKISNPKNEIDYYISNFLNAENLVAYRYDPDYIIQDGEQYVNLLYDIAPGVPVTFTHGVVTGIKKGNAVITCTINTPDNEIIELKCIVTVK